VDVSNAERTLSVVMELLLVLVVLIVNYLLLDQHQQMTVNMLHALLETT